MSLERKLAREAQAREQARIVAAERAREATLEPVRARIKELETQKYQLELIRDSLALESDESFEFKGKTEKTGKGMKEYKADRGKNEKRTKGVLGALVSRHQEIFAEKGVTDSEQLASHPEFTEEPEVVAHNEAKKEMERVSMSDVSLRDRLKSLGVEVSEENFSYDEAEKAVQARWQQVSKELIKEKVKTPEGRVEKLEELTVKMKERIPELSFDENNGISILAFNPFQKGNIAYAERYGVMFSGKTARFEGWERVPLLPEVLSEIEEVYGKELVREALERAYQEKIKEAIVAFDRRKENVLGVKGKIEAGNPAKKERAWGMFSEFKRAQEEFRTALARKSEELKAKGIDFNPKIVGRGWGASYEDFILLAPSKEDSQKIERDLGNNQLFPPSYDYQKIQEGIQKRIDSIKGLTRAVEALSSKEDIDAFLADSRDREPPNSLSQFHFELLGTDFTKARIYFERNSNNPLERDLLSKCQSHTEAVAYLRPKTEEFDRLSTQATAMTEKAIEAKTKLTELEQKTRELSDALAQAGLNTHIYDAEVNAVATMERERREASDLRRGLGDFASNAPQGEILKLERGEVAIPSVENEIKKKEEELAGTKSEQGMEGKLSGLNIIISNLRREQPKLWGKGKWESKLEKLEQERAELSSAITRKKAEIEVLRSRKSFSIPVPYRSGFEGLIRSQKMEGTAEQILSHLRSILDEIINRRIPESVNAPYEEYQKSRTELEKLRRELRSSNF